MSRDLESRVQILEDIMAIENLKHTYLNACDAKDVELMKSTFSRSSSSFRGALQIISEGQICMRISATVKADSYLDALTLDSGETPSSSQ